ncbi:MAG: AAA family ATPase, partial [Patescibacteria group bacterium]|nr:AAA family ATPase [Patescibacteria group bacterium]
MKSRGQKGLAIRYRPATLSEFLGHENLKTAIRKKFSLEKHPSAILFSGSTGSGKTTLARILALALNCPHQKVFGDPCLDCRKLNRDYDITEIPASDSTGINEIRASTEGYLYTPMPPSRVRVYILDEAQRLSGSAQDFLLKPFEDGPATTLWIICTTNPNKILPALRGRCIHWVIPSFRAAQIEELVLKVYEIEKEKGYTTISLSEKDIG